MNLLDGVRHLFASLSKAQDARREPLSKLLEKIESCLEERDLEAALNFARRGLKIFPGERELHKVLQYLEKEEQKRELEVVLKKLAEAPNPLHYAHATELYLKLEQMDQALAMADEARKAFPHKEDPYLILGKIRWERFRKDLIAKDGLEAVENLKETIRLNPGNLNAHCLLGEIHLAVGSSKKALEHFTKVREEGPGWSQLDRLIEEAEKVQDPGLDIELLLKGVEEQNSFPCPFWKSASYEATPPSDKKNEGDSLEDMVKAVEGCTAVLQTFIVDERERGKDREGRHSLGKGVSEISGYAEIAARRMDLGSLQDGIIEGSFGTLVFRAVKGGVVALLADPSLKGEQALALLQEGEKNG